MSKVTGGVQPGTTFNDDLPTPETPEQRTTCGNTHNPNNRLLASYQLKHQPALRLSAQESLRLPSPPDPSLFGEPLITKPMDCVCVGVCVCVCVCVSVCVQTHTHTHKPLVGSVQSTMSYLHLNDPYLNLLSVTLDENVIALYSYILVGQST